MTVQGYKIGPGALSMHALNIQSRWTCWVLLEPSNHRMLK